MAKNIIEKAPFKFDVTNNNYFDLEYIMRYKETDSKGRYLYWDKFRWRLAEGEEPKKAWFATKFARYRSLKHIELSDEGGKYFSFCIPDSLEAKLYKISHIASKGLTPNSSIKRDYLISSLVIEEAISSSQLEGASTTREVAKDLIVSNKKPKNEDEEMIINNYLLMQEIKELKDEDLTIDMILNFHKIATKGDRNNGNIAGSFRDSNSIIIADYEGNIMHQPPDYKTVAKRVQQLCNFANSKHNGEDGKQFIHPIVKAIILHFFIGYEHPFSDGNGRVARALFYWYMIKNGFDYFEYISISSLLKKAPKKYALSYKYSEIDDNDLTYFIDYQLEIIDRAIEELLDYLQVKENEFKELNKLLENSKYNKLLNFIQKDILKKAIKNPGRAFTTLEISADYGVTLSSARKYLSEMVNYGFLANYKKGKTVQYIALNTIRDII